VGGSESYLDTLIPRLHDAGLQLSFWHETDLPLDRDPIGLPRDSASWDVSRLGAEKALASLKEWRPDIIFANGLLDPDLEERVFQIAPVVFVAHGYYGTCISGSKTTNFPVTQPCERTFGWKCLVHYFPKRCGGLSPVTMVKSYKTHSRRLKNISLCRGIVTYSEWMQKEYAAHVPSIDRVFKVPLPIANPHLKPLSDPRKIKKDGPLRLLFLGRMDSLKGGQILIDALPLAASELGRDIKLVFGGEGPQREAWTKRASHLQARESRLRFDFPGWIKGPSLQSFLEETDLLVVPSLWPEPFGIVGVEAATVGVPAAAFSVGGITDWLENGVNGFLAHGSPATSQGLAQAIKNCLQEDAYENLSLGAIKMAQRFSPQAHVKKLTGIFETILSTS
jgi:glycosyltransferase involved in cell wall biosynthesis